MSQNIQNTTNYVYETPPRRTVPFNHPPQRNIFLNRNLNFNEEQPQNEQNEQNEQNLSFMDEEDNMMDIDTDMDLINDSLNDIHLI